MKIFDCHTHIENGLSSYDLDNVDRRNIIFNSLDSYTANRPEVNASDTVSLIFDYANNLSRVMKEINEKKINALKIHSRIQKLSDIDYPLLTEYLKQAPDNIPVIVDAFYYGEDIEHLPSLPYIIKWAKLFPERKFIVAHCGGYEIIKYLFHLRTLPNIYYDLSFSLQYLSDSSLFVDMIKLIKFTDKKKIMFGSDYHWASPKLQYNVLTNIFEKLSLPEKEREMILYYNAEEIFSK
jgi:predicted TIM-barrel fold metal-dependent hydrolase